MCQVVLQKKKNLKFAIQEEQNRIDKKKIFEVIV